MFDQMYVEEKIREMKVRQRSLQDRRVHADPSAEVPRTGVGRVHEVFRRIAEPDQPVPRWRWAFAR